ncbi:MAG: FMN-dependent NADH-azoreductase [Litoreibacter sp.]|nr:FMN-dependent NADH-azoreductase [Litoreibacter sp.]
MMTLLHIDSSARQTGSVTRDLSARIADQLSQGGTEVIRRDISAGFPVLSEDWVSANFTPATERTDAQKAILAASDALVEELKAADTIVIGLPIYNFSVPAAVKTWIDLVARAGLTFKYTENGPEGLLTGKRAIIAVASGGTKAGSEIDFATTYMRHFLGFIGITDVSFVSADQMAIDADAALQGANQQIEALAA